MLNTTVIIASQWVGGRFSLTILKRAKCLKTVSYGLFLVNLWDAITIWEILSSIFQKCLSTIIVIILFVLIIKFETELKIKSKI